MASWDDENYDPEPVTPAKVAVTDKWEGEDEDDDVKDNWEDEEEEKSKEEDDDAPKEDSAPKPKKLTLQEKIAEKERKKREELELRLKEDESELTPEERLKREQESDLNLFMETTLGNKTNFGDDLTNPTTKEEFEEFGANLAKKIQNLAKSIEYPAFADALIRDICVTLTSHDIKKVKVTVDNLYLEKQKMEKGDKAKKNKGKGKVKLKMDDNNQYSAYAIETYNEYDDFM